MAGWKWADVYNDKQNTQRFANPPSMAIMSRLFSFLLIGPGRRQNASAQSGRIGKMEYSDKDTYVSPIIHFEVLGEPQALSRHHVFRRGTTRGYDPNKERQQGKFSSVAHRHAPTFRWIAQRLIFEFIFSGPNRIIAAATRRPASPPRHITPAGRIRTT